MNPWSSSRPRPNTPPPPHYSPLIPRKSFSSSLKSPLAPEPTSLAFYSSPRPTTVSPGLPLNPNRIQLLNFQRSQFLAEAVAEESDGVKTLDAQADGVNLQLEIQIADWKVKTLKAKNAPKKGESEELSHCDSADELTSRPGIADSNQRLRDWFRRSRQDDGNAIGFTQCWRRLCRAAKSVKANITEKKEKRKHNGKEWQKRPLLPIFMGDRLLCQMKVCRLCTMPGRKHHGDPEVEKLCQRSGKVERLMSSTSRSPVVSLTARTSRKISLPIRLPISANLYQKTRSHTAKGEQPATNRGRPGVCTAQRQWCVRRSSRGWRLGLGTRKLH